MLKYTLILAFLLGFSFFANSQVVTVYDKETGEPIELATIRSEIPRASTMTNSRGQAYLNEFKGSEAIEIRLVGYSPLILSYSAISELDYRIPLKQTTVSLDEVVISATNWNQKTSEVPHKVISIQPKTLNLLSPQTAADLLAVSGKVFIQKSQQGGGSPMIRGFATNRLLYTVDGEIGRAHV